MSYRNLINSSLKTAFKAVKSLADDTTLSRQSNSGFDFNSGGVDKPKSSDVPIKVIIISNDNVRSSDSNKVSKVQMMIQVQEATEINVGDTIPLNGSIYRVGPIINSDGFLFLVDAFKEG